MGKRRGPYSAARQRDTAARDGGIFMGSALPVGLWVARKTADTHRHTRRPNNCPGQPSTSKVEIRSYPQDS